MGEKNRSKKHHYSTLMRYAKRLGFGDINTKIDVNSGLHAIIAVHNVTNGPAIGGCRMHYYDSPGLALYDALRLAHMMTIKAAAANLPHGGGKAVIIKPRGSFSRQKLFQSFGRFVNQQKGQYITACDVGTQTSDMDIIAQQTQHVIGATNTFDNNSDPSTHTAKGVFLGIKASINYQLNKDNFNGIHVAIQGAGNVGYALCQLLANAGAKITITDPHQERCQRIAKDFNASVVDCDAIYDVECDVFSPCALGGSINPKTLPRLKTRIIAGSANNQFSHSNLIKAVTDKKILYAPDFIVNAGGLINAAMVHDYNDPARADACIETIYQTVLNLFSTAENNKSNTLVEAYALANRRIQNKRVNGANQDDIVSL
jgi:leucine dehydrogenase